MTIGDDTVLHLIDSSGVVKKEFYLAEFEADDRFRQALHTACRTQDATILCVCQPNAPIPMTINRRKGDNKNPDTIYLSNKKKQGVLHAPRCPLHGAYQPTSRLEQGWEEAPLSFGSDESLVVAKGNAAMFGEKQTRTAKTDTEQTPFYTRTGKSTATSRVTLLGFTSRFLLMTYEAYLKKHRSHPPDLATLLSYNYGYRHQIAIEKGTTRKATRYPLSTLWDDRANQSQAHVGDVLYVLARFDGAEPFVQTTRTGKAISFPEQTRITLSRHKGKGQWQTSTYRCPTHLYESAQKANRHLGANREEGGYTLIAGFIACRETASGFRYWEFVSIELVSVTKTGLWVESGLETRVFHAAIDAQIAFYKPHKPPFFYEDFVPDMVFLTPLTPGKVYIGEIYGMTNNADYNARKEAKRALARQSNRFDTWEWDVTVHATMPAFYPH